MGCGPHLWGRSAFNGPLTILERGCGSAPTQAFALLQSSSKSTGAAHPSILSRSAWASPGLLRGLALSGPFTPGKRGAGAERNCSENPSNLLPGPAQKISEQVKLSACHAEGRGFEPRRSRHFSVTWLASLTFSHSDGGRNTQQRRRVEIRRLAPDELLLEAAKGPGNRHNQSPAAPENAPVGICVALVSLPVSPSPPSPKADRSKNP